MTTAVKHRRDRVTAEIVVSYHTIEGLKDRYGWRWKIMLMRDGRTYANVNPARYYTAEFGYTSSARAMGAARKLAADMGLDVQSERVFG